MNTSALKTFAPAVRQKLMEAIGRKLDFVLTGDTADLRVMPEQRKSLGQQAGFIEDAHPPLRHAVTIRAGLVLAGPVTEPPPCSCAKPCATRCQDQLLAH